MTGSTVHVADLTGAARSSGLLDAEESESFDRLTRLASRLLAVPVSLITVLDQERQFFLSSSGLAEPWRTLRQTPLTHSFCQHVVLTDRPLVVNDSSVHEVVKENLAIEALGVTAYLGVPLRLDNRPFGSLCVIDSEVRAWASEDVACLEDLAHTVLSELYLRKRAEELERLSERQSRMMGVVAHDLRTPLSVILAYSDCLRSELSDPESLTVVEAIGRSSLFMKSLVEDLLDFESLRGGQLALQLKSGSIHGLVRHCVEINRVLSKTRGIELLLSLPEEEVCLRHDSRKLEQVLNNLLGNGLKYCEPGSTIETVVTLRDGGMCLEVRDDGPGIEPHILSTLFEPFVRSNGAGKMGHGLGLAIVDRIIRAHGGRIEVESEVGRGTIFRLLLPF